MSASNCSTRLSLTTSSTGAVSIAVKTFVAERSEEQKNGIIDTIPVVVDETLRSAELADRPSISTMINALSTQLITSVQEEVGKISADIPNKFRPEIEDYQIGNATVNPIGSTPRRKISLPGSRRTSRRSWQRLSALLWHLMWRGQGPVRKYDHSSSVFGLARRHEGSHGIPR